MGDGSAPPANSCTNGNPTFTTHLLGNGVDDTQALRDAIAWIHCRPSITKAYAPTGMYVFNSHYEGSTGEAAIHLTNQPVSGSVFVDQITGVSQGIKFLGDGSCWAGQPCVPDTIFKLIPYQVVGGEGSGHLQVMFTGDGSKATFGPNITFQDIHLEGPDDNNGSFWDYQNAVSTGVTMNGAASGGASLTFIRTSFSLFSIALRTETPLSGTTSTSPGTAVNMIDSNISSAEMGVLQSGGSIHVLRTKFQFIGLPKPSQSTASCVPLRATCAGNWPNARWFFPTCTQGPSDPGCPPINAACGPNAVYAYCSLIGNNGWTIHGHGDHAMYLAFNVMIWIEDSSYDDGAGWGVHNTEDPRNPHPTWPAGSGTCTGLTICVRNTTFGRNQRMGILGNLFYDGRYENLSFKSEVVDYLGAVDNFGMQQRGAGILTIKNSDFVNSGVGIGQQGSPEYGNPAILDGDRFYGYNQVKALNTINATNTAWAVTNGTFRYSQGAAVDGPGITIGSGNLFSQTIIGMPTALSALEAPVIIGPTLPPGASSFTHAIQIYVYGSDTTRYTLDGSTPTETAPASPVYGMPLRLVPPNGTPITYVVRARNFRSGVGGPVVTKNYTIDLP